MSQNKCPVYIFASKDFRKLRYLRNFIDFARIYFRASIKLKYIPGNFFHKYKLRTFHFNDEDKFAATMNFALENPRVLLSFRCE